MISGINTKNSKSKNFFHVDTEIKKSKMSRKNIYGMMRREENIILSSGLH
jgi:hypothetical protein